MDGFRAVSVSSRPAAATSPLVTFLLLTLTGISCPAPAPTEHEPEVVPWIAASPEPYSEPSPPPVPASVPPCRADQLDVYDRGSGAATGHIIHFLGFANTSASECALQGSPKISLVTPGGDVLALPQTGDVFYVAHGPERVALRPGAAQPTDPESDVPPGQGVVAFEWTACPPQPRIAMIVVALPDDGGKVSVRPGRNGIGTSGHAFCEPGEKIEPHLAVGNVHNVEPPTEPPAYTKLAAMIEAPPFAVIGERLRYEVSLSNPTRRDITFDVCPSYVERIASSPGVGRSIKVVGRFRLNCDPVPQIEPGERRTFEMILDIPAETSTGEAFLRWDFQFTGLTSPPSPVSITLRSP